MIFIFIPSLVYLLARSLSLARSLVRSSVRSLACVCIPNKMGTLDRSIHSARGEMRFAICVCTTLHSVLCFSSLPFSGFSLSLSLCFCCTIVLLHSRSIFVIEISQFYDRKTYISLHNEQTRIGECILAFFSSLCACNDDHLSRDRHHRISLLF
jgi:hypothetical protein